MAKPKIEASQLKALAKLEKAEEEYLLACGWVKIERKTHSGKPLSPRWSARGSKLAHHMFQHNAVAEQKELHRELAR